MIVDAVNANPQPPVSDDRLEEIRIAFGALLLLAGEPAPMFAVRDLDADGVPVRVYAPTDATDVPVVVFFHGGGWTIGSVEQFEATARLHCPRRRRHRCVGRLSTRARASLSRRSRRLLGRVELGREERVDVPRRPVATRGDG